MSRKLEKIVFEVEKKRGISKPLASVIFHFHTDGEPHGCFGSQRMIPGSKPPFPVTKQALSYEEELEYGYAREYYDKLVKQCPDLQKEGHVWSTYEKWLEYYRCKCGCHGADGKQPYNGNVEEILKELEKLSPEEKQKQTKETLEWYKNSIAETAGAP